jgi:hypothetical protein
MRVNMTNNRAASMPLLPRRTRRDSAADEIPRPPASPSPPQGPSAGAVLTMVNGVLAGVGSVFVGTHSALITIVASTMAVVLATMLIVLRK